MGYQQMIREAMATAGLIGKAKTYEVEALIRLKHPTLDHLSQFDFNREVYAAVEIAVYDPAYASQVAEIVGVRPVAVA